MTTLSNSPRLMKGAIVAIDPFNPLASVVAFQYNPEQMTRNVEPQFFQSQGGSSEETNRLAGPPKETISLSIEVDAADQLEEGNPLALASGIYPTLAALEMIHYPKSIAVIKNIALAAVGNIEIIPPEAPLTLFVWGPQRVVPVRLTRLSITEEAFDPLLNPLRATVEVGMEVLNYNDFSVTHPGFSLFMAYQVAKEVMATLNVANSAQIVGVELSGL